MSENELFDGWSLQRHANSLARRSVILRFWIMDFISITGTSALGLKLHNAVASASHLFLS